MNWFSTAGGIVTPGISDAVAAMKVTARALTML